MAGLEVVNLKVRVGKADVLKDVTIAVKPGEIHALMGPNGSGKSTLAYAIMGREGYEVLNGDIRVDGESILDLPTHERALRGLFLAFQEPPSIPGVRMSSFLIALRNKREGREDDLFKLSDPRFIAKMREYVKRVGLPINVLQREVNKGFSGGEKKRSELLQALVLEPRYLVLDEPDSGLDVDGVKTVAEILRELANNGSGILLITHYTRMFTFLRPDRVSVLFNGRIVASGGVEIAESIDKLGYQGFIKSMEG